MGSRLANSMPDGEPISPALIVALKALKWYPGDAKIKREEIYKICDKELFCSRRNECEAKNCLGSKKRCLIYPKSFMKPRITRIQKYFQEQGWMLPFSEV